MRNFSAHFIERPVATILLMLGLVLAGAIAYTHLPVSPLPQVDFPVIVVNARLPGASPETMAATVATPLERQLGRIAGVNEITSASSLGSARVVLQFDLSRNINDAAIEVQAAINAARGQLPSGMPDNPTYRKVNPADSPILVLALTSEVHSRGQLYDVASTIFAQKLSQVRGIGQVNVGGSSLPAVRVEVNPRALNHLGIGLDQVRAALVATNSNRPKGLLEDSDRQWWIYANDQAFSAREYMPLIVGYRNGAAVRLADVAEVIDSVQDKNNAALSDGKPAVLLILYREPNANILETVQRVQDLLPWLRAAMPASMEVAVAMERTSTIRASIREVQRTLLIAVGLVVLVVFAFLRNLRATLIPAAAVPVSLIGTFAFMHLAGYSINNLSLMALIVAAGFVVDDAIVVLENTTRYIDRGVAVREAAFIGAREVGFTVLSISLSLVAVFIPILLMGDIVGRYFREFAVTLSISILISLVVSLTLTPMMCAKLLRPPRSPGLLNRGAERVFSAVLRGYERSLAFVLRHSFLTILVLAGVIALNVHLYQEIPKGFFPRQDTGRLFGSLRADQSAPFAVTLRKMEAFVELVRADPAVETVTASIGGGSRRSGVMFVSLKPLAERSDSAAQVVARLRNQSLRVPGARLYLFPAQDVRIGGRQASSTYQYTLRSDDLELVRTWTPRLQQALQNAPELEDVDSDQEIRGLQLSLVIDRTLASRLGVTTDMIDSTLGNSFGQAVVSTIYRERNQYRVVLGVEERYARSPEELKAVHVRTRSGATIPLSAIASYEFTNTPLSVNHQSQFASSTISFNLAEGVALSDATARIADTMAKIGMPTTIFGSYEGTARGYRRTLQYQPALILAAIVAVYIVLGILYESVVHPLTILSTLPSAGVGALLALMLFETEFGVIALIAVFLLIGIVKKNAIMMVDFALDAERREGKRPEDAIFEACRMRFRPIMMTTFAAMLGALPLALGAGDGAELRTPLGIAIVGGLMLSQLLTLYTTPVVYLYLDRFRLWCLGLRRSGRGGAQVRPQ
jgi:multidrug efflux pump